jgi:hypothetical protein
MEQEGQNWFTQLNASIEQLRKENPLSARDQLNDSEEWQCKIVGSSLLNWLENVGPNFLQERSVFCKVREIEPDPFLVFTSNTPGLVAAREIVGEDNERIVFLDDSEFDDWLKDHPDKSYRWHVHVWSYFRDSLESEFHQKAEEEYPISEESSYWQHSEGTMWADLAGRGVDHLWRWDGNGPELLEEAFTNWVT